MGLTPAGLVLWGLAAGAAAAAVRGWGSDGPASALGLAVALVVTAKLAGAGAAALRRRLRRLSSGGVALPSWPPPYQGARGALARSRPGLGLAGFRRKLALFALAALAGGWAGAWRLEQQAAALRPYEAGRVAWVGGYVVEPPRRTRFVTYLILRAARLSHETSDVPPTASWQSLPGDVEVVVPGEVHAAWGVRPGAWVAARGLVRVPEPAAHPGGFSLRRYLQARGVVLVVQVRAADRFAAGPAPWPPPPSVRLRTALASAGQAGVQRLRARLSPRGAAWAEAVGLGRREALSRDEQDALGEAGLGHLLSVSGLHVGLLAGPLVAAARAVARASAPLRAVAAAAACGAGWVYATMTGLAAPAVRAGLVQSVALAAWAFGRSAGLVNSLGAAAAAQLLVGNPGLGADAGFQMSYLATLGIGLFLEGRGGWGGRRPGTGRRAGLRQALQGALRRMLDALGISFAAWAAVSPLAALYFGRASLVGAVVSVAAAPLSGVLLWSALLTAAAPAPLFRPAAWVADASAVALRRVALAGAELEGRWGVRLSAHAWTLPAVGGLALAVVAADRLASRRRGGSGAALTAALLAGWLVLAELRPGEAGPASVVSMPLGHGWAVVGRARTGEGWLFVRARDGQELDVALQKAGAALAGLGVARAKLAAWQPAEARGHPPVGLSPLQARVSRSWVAVGAGGLVLLRLSGPPVRAQEVRSGSLRLVAVEPARNGVAWGLWVEMEGSGAVRLDPQAACLRWEPPGYQACRRDGSVHLSER